VHDGVTTRQHQHALSLKRNPKESYRCANMLLKLWGMELAHLMLLKLSEKEKTFSSLSPKLTQHFKDAWAQQTNVIQWKRLQLNLKLRLRVCSCEM
jgi:hypothetical protein